MVRAVLLRSPVSYRNLSSRIVILVRRLRRWRFSGQSRRSVGNQGIQGRQGDGIQGGHCTRIIPTTKATTVTTTTAYPRYMNFIVARMIISDMRTSCDQHALLYRNTARARAAGRAAGPDRAPCATRPHHRRAHGTRNALWLPSPSLHPVFDGVDDRPGLIGSGASRNSALFRVRRVQEDGDPESPALRPPERTHHKKRNHCATRVMG